MFLTQLNVKRQLEVIGLISQSWNYVNLFVWAIWHVLAQPILGLLGLDFLFCEQWLVRKIKNDDWFIHKLFLESDLFNETLMNQSEWFLINLTDQVLTKLKVKNSHPFSCCYWCYCKRFIHACVVSEELEYSAKVIYYVWFFLWFLELWKLQSPFIVIGSVFIISCFVFHWTRKSYRFGTTRGFEYSITTMQPWKVFL